MRPHDPLRIEMLLPSMARAGMEMVSASLARGLSKRGHEVGFTCTEEVGELGEQLMDEGYRVSVVPAPGLRPNVLPRELAPWLHRVAPDVVHVHGGLWLKGAQAARSAGVPRVMLTLHGIAPVQAWYLPLYYRLAVARADVVTAVTPTLEQHLLSVAGAPRHKLRLIVNGIPTERFAPGTRSPALRRALGIPADAPVAGNVARLHPVKNHELLLDAFALLLHRHPAAHLLLVGDGPQRVAVEEHAGRLGIAARVHITGVVPDSAPYLREMDVFALSSHIEGLSISLLEAMASGVPVVATAVGGTPLLLQEGACGRLVTPGDAAGVANAIGEILAGGKTVAAAVACARAIVLEHYSMERMVHAYEEAYLSPPTTPRGTGRSLVNRHDRDGMMSGRSRQS
jgi:glycosyltransferase involved in cell wall biosynthesis